QVGAGVRSEDAMPLLALVENVRIVVRVAGLVAEVHHRFFRRLEMIGNLLLEPGEARIHQVERHRDHRHALGATPFIAEVDRRLELHSDLVELEIELLNERLQLAPLDAKIKLIDPRMQQTVAVLVPGHRVGGRPAIGRSMAICTMRSIRSACEKSGVARRAAMANSARESSHGFGFTSSTNGVPSAVSRMSTRA